MRRHVKIPKNLQAQIDSDPNEIRREAKQQKYNLKFAYRDLSTAVEELENIEKGWRNKDAVGKKVDQLKSQYDQLKEVIEKQNEMLVEMYGFVAKKI